MLVYDLPGFILRMGSLYYKIDILRATLLPRKHTENNMLAALVVIE